MAIESQETMAPSGVYEYPETGQRLIYRADAKLGNSGADAAIRVGFKFIGNEAEAAEAEASEKAEEVVKDAPEAEKKSSKKK